MVVFVLGRGEGFGETGARLRVGLLVDRAQVALYHAHRDAEFLGDLLERAFILGHGYEHVDFARGESVVGDEGLALLFDGGIGAGLHGQDGNGREHGDAEHDKSHVAALGKVKDKTGGKAACRQKEARPGLHGNGAVGVGECDHVVEGREQAGKNHDERDAPA